MVKTPRGLNKSGKATKGRKRGVGLSDDACMEVEAPILNQKAQKIKGKKDVPDVNNNYLPWVDYTNVCELDNPRESGTNRDDDLGGEWSHDELGVEEKVIGEEVVPIVEERVIDSSVADMSEAADVSDPSVNPSVEDTTGKTIEPSVVCDRSTDKVGEHVLEGDGVDVSQAYETVTEKVRSPSAASIEPVRI
ncbi:hypothetical protein LIER_40837 [Lithospermum erythrorhizon]|uniref:Uncharacterized protein n=1 Tax=Lithospermum erythrorhizon TaxID=34254 RepID=A0AAV3R0K7_LITER